MLSSRWLALWLALCLAPAAFAEDATLCRQAWEAGQARKNERALELYRECLAKGPLSPQNTALVERNVGILLYDAGEFVPAAEAFGRAIAVSPPDAASNHLSRGWAWFKASEPRKALADFDETLELDPKQAKAVYGRGVVLEQLGREFDAYAEYQRAGELGLDDEDVKARLAEYEMFGLQRSAAYRGEGFGEIGSSYAVRTPVRAVKLGSISESKASCLASDSGGVSESPHLDAESLRRAARFGFSAGKVEVVFPQLDGMETLDVWIHLDDLSRGVRDDYLVFSPAPSGKPSAAVLVTTLAKRMRSSLEVHRAILDQVEELGAAFPRGDVVVRDLEGPWGPVVELLARNRAGGGVCFPTSVWARAPETTPTIGVTRWVHRADLLVELELIVPTPKDLPAEKRAEHARARMDELMGGVSIQPE